MVTKLSVRRKGFLKWGDEGGYEKVFEKDGVSEIELETGGKLTLDHDSRPNTRTYVSVTERHFPLSDKEMEATDKSPAETLEIGYSLDGLQITVDRVPKSSLKEGK